METLSRLVLTFVLNAVWQFTLVVAIAAVCARLLRRAPARYLHGLWVGALTLGAFLPLTSLPAAWKTAANPSRSSAIMEIAPPVPAAISARVLPVPLAPAAEPSWLDDWFSRDSLRHRSHPISLPRPLGFAVLGVYLLAFLCHTTRLARGWLKTARLRQAVRHGDLPGGLAPLVEHCRAALGVKNVSVLCSSQASGPATMGTRRPVIILPEALVHGSPSEELIAALCHEMAHIRRRDYLVNLICELAFLPVAFHPVAWFVKRRIDETRELACDEVAAGQLAGAGDYARSLLSLARALYGLSSISSARYSLGVFDANILEERIMRLLEQRPRLGQRRARLFMGGAVLAFALAGLGASAFSFRAQENAEMQKPAATNFSGRWELDKGKSELPSPAPNNLVQRIVQHDSEIKIDSKSKDWDVNQPIAVTLFAMMIPELTIRPDSRESVAPFGPGQMRSKSHWEGGELITDWTLEREGQVMVKGKWARSLSSDGKTQTVQITAHDPNRNLDGEAKAVFVKTGDQAHGFLGSWRGEFQGKTFLVVNLERAGDSLGGTISIGGFSIDGSGQVKRVDSEPTEREDAPIFDAKLDSALLTFKAKIGTPASELQFQMRLTGDGLAELKGLAPHMPPGAPTGGWWKLTKQSGGPNAEVRESGTISGFAGTWRGTAQGKTWLTLSLWQEGGRPVGNINIGNMHGDDYGRVLEVIDEPKPEYAQTIMAAEIKSATLYFKSQRPPDGHVNEFEMKLTGQRTADLKFQSPGVVYPWTITKESDDPPRPQVGIVEGVPGGVNDSVRAVKGSVVGGVVGGVPGGVRGGHVEGIKPGVVGGIVAGVPSQGDTKGFTLSGTVSDPSGARVPNAALEIDGENRFRKMAAANDVGEFSFTGLPDGRYELQAIHKGFSPFLQNLVISQGSVRISGARTTGQLKLGSPGAASPLLNIILEPSSEMQSLEVTAKAPPEVVQKRRAVVPKRIRVGGQIQEAKLVVRKAPEYPESAHAKGIEGRVLLEAVISIEGVPLSLKALESPDPALSDAALAAVRQWRYQPTLLNGQPIEVVTTISISFRLVDGQ